MLIIVSIHEAYIEYFDSKTFLNLCLIIVSRVGTSYLKENVSFRLNFILSECLRCHVNYPIG